MKTIIIPTDFSSAADNAMHYGAKLAQDLQAQILLLHVYMVPITMNDMPVLMVTAEELKGGADDGLMRCKSELEAAYPGLIVKTESRLGDVVDELKGEIIGSRIWDEHKSWPLYSKFFDNMGAIPHHLHQSDALAKLVGQKGKPEAEIRLAQLVLLDHRSHGAVEHKNAFGEQAGEFRATCIRGKWIRQ